MAGVAGAVLARQRYGPSAAGIALGIGGLFGQQAVLGLLGVGLLTYRADQSVRLLVTWAAVPVVVGYVAVGVAYGPAALSAALLITTVGVAGLSVAGETLHPTLLGNPALWRSSVQRLFIELGPALVASGLIVFAPRKSKRTIIEWITVTTPFVGLLLLRAWNNYAVYLIPDLGVLSAVGIVGLVERMVKENS